MRRKQALFLSNLLKMLFPLCIVMRSIFGLITCAKEIDATIQSLLCGITLVIKSKAAHGRKAYFLLVIINGNAMNWHTIEPPHEWWWNGGPKVQQSHEPILPITSFLGPIDVWWWKRVLLFQLGIISCYLHYCSLQGQAIERDNEMWKK